MSHVNTKQIKRRPLRFQTIDHALQEAERLAAADRAGTLRCSGNWTLGQALGHCATWIGYAFDGYPAVVKAPPFPMSLVLKLMRPRILDHGMPPGVRVAGIEGGTLGTEPLSTHEGLARFRKEFTRLKAASPMHPSPVFGAMTHEQWIKLNLRHAELHLGFMDAP